MIRRGSNSTALRKSPSDIHHHRCPFGEEEVVVGTASEVAVVGSILLVGEDRRSPVGEMVSI
jgi:hypothetical protein